MFYCWTALEAIIFNSSPFAKLKAAARSPSHPLPVPVELLMSKRACFEFIDDDGEWRRIRDWEKQSRNGAASQVDEGAGQQPRLKCRRNAGVVQALSKPNELADPAPLEIEGGLQLTVSCYV